MLEEYIRNLINAIMESVASNMFAPDFTTPQSSIDGLKTQIGFYVAVFLLFAHKNPKIMNPPYLDLDKTITDLVDFYMEAYLENNSSEDDPLSDEEILNNREGFIVWIRALLTYANTALEGIMWPPYVYSRPYPINALNRLNEFIEGLSSSLTSALIAAAFPPAFPASTQDVEVTNSFHRVFVQAALTYAHNNPGIASPPYSV